MSHEIETHQGQAAAIFGRVDAWHRLGTTVAGRAFTAEEAMTLGHLGGWDVRKCPIQSPVLGEDGVHLVEVPNRYATIRTNPFTGQPEALGVVGETYTVIQNEQHAEFLNLLVDESGAIFDTAGSLRGGRQTFVTLQMPQTMTIGQVDEVRLNIAALNSHDGSMAFRLLVTPVRVVCANTQAAALRDARASWSTRHTNGAAESVTEARNTLGLTFKYAEAFQAEAEAMIQQTMTDGQFWAMVGEIFPEPAEDASKRTQTAAQDRADRLEHLWADAATQQAIRGTRWAGYQAVTEYLDHYAAVRTKGDKATARAQRTLTSPDVDRLKATAWQLARV